jgi:hypothetical protein
MEAQFDSTCPACGCDIQIGDEIVNDDGPWVHEECAGITLGNGPTRTQVTDALSACMGPDDVAAEARATLDLAAKARERREAAGHEPDMAATLGEVLSAEARAAGLLPAEDVRPQPEYRTRDRWGRYVLVHPAKPDKRVTLTRATTLNKAADDMFNLMDWKSGNVAVGLARRPDLLARAAGMKSGDKALKDIVKAAEEAGGGSVKANLGTAMHTFTEMVDWGRPLEDIPDEYRDDVAAYLDALRSERLEVVRIGIERITMTSEWDGVAGKLDRIYRQADGRYVIGDVKSGKIDYSPQTTYAQLAVYARGVNEVGVYDVANECWERLPFEIDEDTALIMHMPAGEGVCNVFEADLAVGRAHLEVCAAIRRHRKIKHKLKPYTAPERSGPEWVEAITATRTRDDLAAVGRLLEARKAMTPDLFALAMRHRGTLPE